MNKGYTCHSDSILGQGACVYATCGGLHVIVKKMSKMEDSFFLVGVGVGLCWRGGGLFIKRIFFQVYTPLPNVI